MPYCSSCGEVIEDMNPSCDDLCEDCFEMFNNQENNLLDDTEDDEEVVY